MQFMRSMTSSFSNFTFEPLKLGHSQRNFHEEMKNCLNLPVGCKCNEILHFFFVNVKIVENAYDFGLDQFF